MALAPVRLALTGLPVMRRQGHGRIVTIASIGGKLSVPHLLPYSTAKFAAVGFSEGFPAELGRGPGPLTTVGAGLSSEALHLVQRLALPAPGQAAQGGEPVPGHELNPALPRKTFDRLTTLGRAAASRLTQR